MNKSNRVPVLLISSLAWSVSAAVQAASFGVPDVRAVMGQPLQAWVPLAADSDEGSAPDCLVAEVVSGDNPLPSGQVRVQLIPGQRPGLWTAKVTTTSPIEEPLLQMTLSAGCQGRFSRQFVLLADPPWAEPRTPLAPSGVQPPVALESPPSPAVAAPRVKRRSAPDAAVAVAEPASAPASRRRSARHPAGSAAVAAGPAPQSRLQLEPAEPVLPAPPVAASAPASAAEPLTPAPVPGVDPQVLKTLQAHNDSMREANEALRQRLESAERQTFWLSLALGLGLLGAAGGGYGLWQRQRRLAEAAPWWSESRGAGAAGLSSMPHADDSGVHDDAPGWVPPPSPVPVQVPPPEPVRPLFDVASDWQAPSTPGESTVTLPEPPATATTPLTPAQVPTRRSAPDADFNPSATVTFHPAHAPREVSVEELLDLEQQADFFIALGQEEAAVEVLMSHLRSTGGQSPLPYTKLLEIYRRQGDRSAYERVRARFNRRFNAYAPDWDIGPAHGRHLEDYPEAVREVQLTWHSPLDAMATLEAMLFRRDESRELFDLPAYRDLLMLYAIARDLWQQAGGQADEVDLLLPITDSVLAEPLDLELDLDSVSPGTATAPMPADTLSLAPREGESTRS